MDKHYEYGIISSNGNLILFNDSVQEASLFTSEFLKDVNVTIRANGILEIHAYRIEYDFYSHSDSTDFRRVFEESWRRTPHPKCIKEGKRHFWSRKKERYVNNGWVRTTETTPVEFVLNKYKIDIRN